MESKDVVELTRKIKQKASSTRAVGSSDSDFLKVHLLWKSLYFEVEEVDQQKVKAKKTILSDVFGQCMPGTMTAILGGSGSGKTSLLNILSHRRTRDVRGTIHFNGKPMRTNALNRIAGYVTQEPVFIPSLTPFETLMYAAELRMSSSFSIDERKARVESLIQEFDLEKCKNTLIGAIGSGLSGGERKRLQIAMELIAEPSVLFADEVTSGLDAASALLVMKMMKRLAESGRTIVITIHQPRASILRMIDSIFLLAEGRQVYFGPTVPTCVEFFKENGFHPKEFENIADWMLDVINTADEEIDEKRDDDYDNNDKAPLLSPRLEVIEKLSKAYASSKYHRLAMQPPSEMPPPISQSATDMAAYPTSWFTQMRVILSRSFYHKLREPIAVMTQFFNTTFLVVLVGLVYLNIPLNNANGADDRLSAMSFLILLQTFMAFDILLLLPLERDIYFREHESGLYCTSAYYLGRTLSETPFHSVFAMSASTIAYFMLGFQREPDKFFIFLLVVVLVTLAGSSLLLFVGSISKNLEQSNVLAQLFLVLFMLFDGNWVTVDNIPVYFIWVHYLSPNKWAVAVAAKNEFSGLRFKCNPATDPINCPFSTGEQYLQLRDLYDVDIPLSCLYLAIMVVFYRVAAYFCLRYLHHPKK